MRSSIGYSPRVSLQSTHSPFQRKKITHTHTLLTTKRGSGLFLISLSPHYLQHHSRQLWILCHILASVWSHPQLWWSFQRNLDWGHCAVIPLPSFSVLKIYCTFSYGCVCVHMCVSVCKYVFMWVCAYVCSTCKGQKNVSDILQLEL